jgi:hypothetical protein
MPLLGAMKQTKPKSSSGRLMKTESHRRREKRHRRATYACLSSRMDRTWPPVANARYPMRCDCETCRLLRAWRSRRGLRQPGRMTPPGR